jgi:glutamine synthetase
VRRPPHRSEENSLLRWLKDRRITEVECLVPDMTGMARGKIIPAAKFSHDYGTRLPEGIFVTTVTGDYPTTTTTWSRLRIRTWCCARTRRRCAWCRGRSIRPRRSSTTATRATAACTTWRRAACCAACSTCTRKRAAADRGAGTGILPGAEEHRSGFPAAAARGPFRPPETARQSYSIDAVNEFDPILDLMYDYAEAMELDVDTLIHESGAAQLEVNFQHADPMSRADQVFLFKRTMREAALRHGIYATFLAKPMENEPGSAMHIHQSLLDAKTGVNVFAGRKAGGNSKLFGHYLAGLQKYVPMAMAFFAPNVNSYRRLAMGEVAPINVEWGYDNRTCGLRVPLDTIENTRVESRFAGSDANPYLAMAATLCCGLLGIQEELTPTKPLAGSAQDLGYALPRSLQQSLDALENARAAGGVRQALLRGLHLGQAARIPDLPARDQLLGTRVPPPQRLTPERRANGHLDTATLQRLDAAHHLHPFNDNAALAKKGTRILTRGEGVYVWDSQGNKLLDAFAGLWCVNIGYGAPNWAPPPRSR